jgi:hypothetical protein
MPYPPLVMLHVAAGLIAILAGFWVFVGAMLAMAGLGAALAIAAGEPVNIVAGGLTLYLVVSGAQAVRRPAAGGEAAGKARLRRHVWRMCTALFVASGSFFLGQQDEFPRWALGPHLVVPPLAALATLAWWMHRLRTTKRPRARSHVPVPETPCAS